MINTFIQTYEQDKTQFTIYKNNEPILQQQTQPYGINIFTSPASLIIQSIVTGSSPNVQFRPINGISNTVQQINPTPPLTNTNAIELFYAIKFLNLIYTNPGEHLLDPEYGVDFRIYPFNTNSTVVLNGITQAISHACNKYLPNVSVSNVVINTFDVNNHLLDITFTILIKPINTITNVGYNIS